MYIISYDIESDRCRNKVSKELENYGKRVQYSVFECNITAQKSKEIYSKLMKLVKEEEGADIRFYPLCTACEKKIQIIGSKQIEELDEETIVI